MACKSNVYTPKLLNSFQIKNGESNFSDSPFFIFFINLFPYFKL